MKNQKIIDYIFSSHSPMIIRVIVLSGENDRLLAGFTP